MNFIEKPIQRSLLRRKLGKEFYIFKRFLKWHFSSTKYSKVDNNILLQYSLKKHKSILLRQLKNVDMYLQYNKITNLKLAIKNINNVIIKPGETFSIWKLVGRPSKIKGYKEGMMIHNGKVSSGIGGGLCQLGNLIYWMALHSPLTVKERWRHSFDVFPDVNRTIPFACGATLAYNYIDLQLENQTNNTFQIKLWIDEEYLNGELLCDYKPNKKYEIFETDQRFQLQFWGGYTRHNKIWRRIIDIETNENCEELIAENNAIMTYNPVLKE
ncbi:MAG: VanW family protein [Bacteroidales bacterium]|nr:VanW family protein [Bacteroidales bacterium]